MPEGPEIKFIGELCKKKLLDYKLIDIKSNSKDVVKLPVKSKLIDVQTKGKLLVLIFNDFYFHIHFGLTGWFTFDSADYPKYELTFQLGDKTVICYIDDLRRFSKLKIYLNKSAHQKMLDKLGIDILTKDFTEEYFSEKIKKQNKSLSAILLEQDKFAGIGNYIKNESLYLARINPHNKTSDLNDDSIKLLYESIKFVAYSNTIDLLKEKKLHIESILKSIKTKVPYYFNVYEQERDLKGNTVTEEIISGRRTFYVKSIQK
jgi:formamidopyrimidine-DNA glycosylase